jgi:hypothetical protein
MEISILGIHLRVIGVQSCMEAGVLMIFIFKGKRSRKTKKELQNLGKEQGNYFAMSRI